MEKIFKTSIPARLDRLPWSIFHWEIIFALGITWILDGLEVTLKGAVSSVLLDPQTLGLSAAKIGLISSFYLTGAVLGSLLFGYLTDRHGRKKLFFITLSVYLVGVTLSAFSWNLWSFCLFRFITGAGIGGEYSAINSAIDELIPARVRGRVGLIINGSYWIGAALGSLSTLLILNPKYFAVDVGWRVGFAAGGLIGLAILFLRKFIPESPRWLMVHNREQEAERIVKDIEVKIESTGFVLLPVDKFITINPDNKFSFPKVIDVLLHKYRRRTICGLALMTSQAFMYNAIFFTYALILTTFYSIPAKDTGLYLLPFALGNFLGPLILGHLFDSVGRRKMIFLTYIISAILLATTGYLFSAGLLSAASQTALWTIIFFFGSAAASSAYLTVSEVFPLEMRGLAIALFFAVGTATGGIIAPWLFGTLIGTGNRVSIFYGYLSVSVIMVIAAVVQIKYGVDAERKSLEDLAPPLSRTL